MNNAATKNKVSNRRGQLTSEHMKKLMLGPSPLAQGITLVAVQTADQLQTVHAILTHAMVTRSTKLPVPLPEFDRVVTVHSGSVRVLDQTEATAKAFGLTGYDESEFCMVKRESVEQIDWMHPAGLLLGQSQIKKYPGCCILLQQPIGLLPSVAGLYRIRQLAEATKSWVIMLYVDNKSNLQSEFGHAANDFFTVTCCDPDPGWHEAFILDCVELSRSGVFGAGKTMCSAKLAESGFSYEFDPVISADLKIRLMAILKGQNSTMEQIGKILKVDKSTVSRNLRGIPSLHKQHWNSTVLEQWLEACGLSLDTAAAKDDWDIDDDDDEDALDAPAVTPKVVALPKRNERKMRNKPKPKFR